MTRHFGENDLGLFLKRQIVEGGDDVPAVHLTLVDLLGAVIEAGGIAKPDRVGGREHPEAVVGRQHPILVKQRQLALGLENTLDNEHHIGSAGVVFIETKRHRMLQRPRQQAFAKLGDLFAVTQHDGVLADQVDTADVAVEVNPDAGPVEPRRDLLDMGRLAGAVIALDHAPAVVAEAGENRQGGFRVEMIGLIDFGDMLGGLGKAKHFHINVNAEHLAHRYGNIGAIGRHEGQVDGILGIGH